MKCDDCLNLLEEYIDREAGERDAEQVRAHLITCGACAKQFEALTSEVEMYARYDRDLEMTPSTWNAIAANIGAETRSADSRQSLGGWFAGWFALPRIAFALPAMAVMIVAVAIGFMFLRNQRPIVETPRAGVPSTTSGRETRPDNKPDDLVATSKPVKGNESIRSPKLTTASLANLSSRSNVSVRTVPASYESDVLDADSSDIEDKETADHVEQAQNLLRSIRNVKSSDEDDEVDVSYEKAMSRRLLDQNVVLRRDAEMAGKFPAKKLLGDLEPFLIDIANLPDKTKPGDLQVIKDRLQKTEMVAALLSY